MTDPTTIFDRALVRRRRDRAAATLAGHDYLHREIAERLGDRLGDIDRRFARALDLGCHGGQIGRLAALDGQIDWLAQCDLAPAMAAMAPRGDARVRLAGDEEALPFAAAVFDLVLSATGLQWVNDLPGTLIQLRRALAPDGVLLACLPGGATLGELRAVLTEAELAEDGGASPRISPFVDIRDAAALLQRAGFAMPVVDGDRIAVTYADPRELLRDLRRSGEANALVERRRAPLRRGTLARAMALYRDRYPAPGGRISATFEILTLTGWAPHADQPKPLRPGSATQRLAAALGAEEQPAGEAAPRRSGRK